MRFNSKIRIKIALEIYRILIRTKKSNQQSDDEIIFRLKKLIRKSPYLGRLSYLLNKSNSYIITKHLKKIIKVVRMFIKNSTLTSYRISKETGLKRDDIQNIINEKNKEKKKVI